MPIPPYLKKSPLKRDELLEKYQTIFAKIVAMGMLPGIKVGIKQKIPSLRCRFGYTEYAIDDSIAKVILVEKE